MPGQEKRRFVLAVLLVVSGALTALEYGDFPLVDTGILWFHDDDFVLDIVRRGLSVETILPKSWYAISPLLFLIYHGMYNLFGRTWLPYGVVVVALHWLMCSTIGFVIWRLSRSLLVSLTACTILAASYALRPRGQFVDFYVYSILILIGIVTLATRSYLAKGDRRDLLLLGGACAASALLTITGIVALAVGIIVAVVFSYGDAVWSKSAGGDGGRRLRRVGMVMGLIGLLYSLAAGYVYLVQGNRLPWLIEHGAGEATPRVIRFVNVVSYGFVGVYPFRDFVVLPEFVQEHGLTVGCVIGTLFVGAAAGAVRSWREAPEESRMYVAACGWLVSSMVYVAVAVTGRGFLQMFHLRYGAIALVFSVMALACLVGALMYRGGARRRLAAVVVVLTGVWITGSNLKALAESRRDEAREVGMLFEARGKKPPPGWSGGPGGTGGLLGGVAARAVRVTAPVLSVPSHVETTLPLSELRFSSVYYFEGSGQIALPIRAPGTYVMIGNVSFGVSKDGVRRASIVRNGAAVIARTEAVAHDGEATNLTVQGIGRLAAGDSLELRVFQDSGKPLEILSGVGYSAEFAIARVLPRGERRFLWFGWPWSRVEAARATRQAGETVPAGQWVTLELDEERFDGAGMYDARRSRTRLFARSSGIFLVVGKVSFGLQSRGPRHVAIVRNEDDGITWQSTGASPERQQVLTVSALWEMKQGDFVELRVLKGSADASAGSNWAEKAEFMMVRVEDVGVVLKDVAALFQ